MNNDFMQEFTVEQMRLQRHEFMNYLQVIYGYIQINRPQEAVNYIKGINKKMTVLSQLFNLECSNFALLMQDLIIQLNKHGIDVEFNTELEYISCETFSKNIVEKSKLFITIKDIIVNDIRNKDNKIYIDLTEENNRIRMFFSNNHEVCLNSFGIKDKTLITIDRELGQEINLYENSDGFMMIFDVYY